MGALFHQYFTTVSVQQSVIEKQVLQLSNLLYYKLLMAGKKCPVLMYLVHHNSLFSVVLAKYTSGNFFFLLQSCLLTHSKCIRI